MIVTKKGRAVLTTGTIVTADSIWNSGSNICYDNCLSGLVDNKLVPGANYLGDNAGNYCN